MSAIAKRAAVPDTSMLAIAVLVDRIRSFSADDKEDLFELTKVMSTAETPEEYDSANQAAQEILEQNSATVVQVPHSDQPDPSLDSWISYISERIKTLRNAASLTQEELSFKTGIPQSHISRLENGEHSPSFVTLEKIASGLGIHISELDPSSHKSEDVDDA